MRPKLKKFTPRAFEHFFIAYREDKEGGEKQRAVIKKKGLLRSLTRSCGRRVACAFCVPPESYFMFLFALFLFALSLALDGLVG